MIIKKSWGSRKGINLLFGFSPKYQYTGWFLFGIIPLFIIRR